jgi:hypothetical protein
MEGVHVKVVSERAEHADVNTTLNKYAAYIPNMQADAALRVDAWLRQGVKGRQAETARWNLGGERVAKAGALSL